MKKMKVFISAESKIGDSSLFVFADNVNNAKKMIKLIGQDKQYRYLECIERKARGYPGRYKFRRFIKIR